MTLERRRVLLLVIGLVGAALLVRPAQDRVDARLRRPSGAMDLLYFSSPEVVKRLALGYQGFVADIYWMRAIQYYGRRDEAARRAVRYGNLLPLLEITTALDPDLIDAYYCGAAFLSEPEPVGAGRPEQAVALLDRGIARHPSEWRLQFEKGFVYFWFSKDHTQAGHVWLAASRLPTAPHWMEGLAAMALSKSGAVETARALWERQYQHAVRQDVKENARNHLVSLQVDEDRWTLEYLLRRYWRQHGRAPRQLADLVLAGLLTRELRDPSGTPYHFDPATGTVGLSPASKVRYLKIPYDYDSAFRKKLVHKFGPE